MSCQCDGVQLRGELRNPEHTPIHARFLLGALAFGRFGDRRLLPLLVSIAVIFVWPEIWHFGGGLYDAITTGGEPLKKLREKVEPSKIGSEDD